MSLIDTAISAALAAGERITEASKNRGALAVEQKAQFDYVSEVDRDCELLIRSHIAERYPDHAFLGEEFGCSQNQPYDQQPLWIVDPLDGTTNFLRQIPHYAVSIAVTINGHTEHAVVYDVAKRELFQASRGEGCQLNGKPLKRLDRGEFSSALLATGVPYSGQNLAELDAFTQTMQALLAKGTSGIRRLGSAALDLAYVAAGRYDGFWEANLKPWDIAAGALLVTEVGGLVGDFSGDLRYLESGDIVAAPSSVFTELISVTFETYRR